MIAISAAVLIPILTAVAAIMLHHQPRLQRIASIAGAVLLLLNAMLLLRYVTGDTSLSVAMGDWPLPYAIEFVADRLSAIMVLVTALVGLGVLVYTVAMPQCTESSAMMHPLIHGLLAAVCGTLLTADLFNLYVWFELMLITVLGMLVAQGGLRNLDAAFRYFAINLLGTLLFLTAVALIYGSTGQLNFNGLAEAMQHTETSQLLPVYIAVLMIAFLLKTAAFPLYFWLPASYHTLPIPLMALIGGLITKVGIYVMLRLLGEVFTGQPWIFYQALGWIAVITMVSGVLGAAYHWDLRRILAFHIISQIGYLLLAVALVSPQGSAAGMFFMVHNILAKATLFLIAGMMWRTAGHYDLRRIGGLYSAQPLLALFFLVAGFSLVGVPPSSGYWGKFMLVQEAFSQGYYAWGGIALAVGMLTLYSMVKIWIEGFWKPHPAGQAASLSPPLLSADFAVIFVFVILLIVLGVYPEPLIQYTVSATDMLWPRGQ